MLGKTVGWWVATVAVSGATMGCNAVLGWELPAEGSPPSCANIEVMCGVGEATGDCCASPRVPGAAGTPCFDAIQGIRLDAYEVTVGRFREFLSQYDVRYKPPAWDLDWQTSAGALQNAIETCGESMGSTWSRGDNFPVNCVTWAEAYAFCKWDEGRLPTEAEFDRAARWNGQQLVLFPWGDAGIDDKFAVFGGHTAAFEVGTAVAGQSKWCQFDLVGNVQEWMTLRNAETCPGGEFNPDAQSSFGGTFGTSKFIFDDAGIPNEPNPPKPDKRRADTGFRCARKL